MIHRFLTEISGALTLAGLAPLVLLAASYGPQTNAAIVILGSLRVHLAVLTLGFALGFFLLRRPLRGLAFTLAGLGVLAHLAVVLLPHTAPGRGAPGAAVLTVMDFNVLGYNTANGGRITDHILDQEPDVVFIQEAKPLAPHLDRLDAVYPHRIGCGRYYRNCDSLMLSKYPLSEPDYYMSGAFAANRFFITSVTVDGQTVSLAALHLSKAERGSAQAREYARAAQKIAALPDPVIAAGDFNTAFWAPRFVAFLAESGLKRALIEPATWPGGRGFLNHFGLPIDHILVRGAAITALDLLPESFGSNHRGQMARIALTPE